MLKLPPITRVDLLDIAMASPAFPHPALLAVLRELGTAGWAVNGNHTIATEDEIESFDIALDTAEL